MLILLRRLVPDVLVIQPQRPDGRVELPACVLAPVVVAYGEPFRIRAWMPMQRIEQRLYCRGGSRAEHILRPLAREDVEDGVVGPRFPRRDVCDVNL